jgi:uncharacterized protein YndB with AHSA1/START domain
MPGAPVETDAVEHEIRIAARPETVFSYFTDPSKMVEWFGVEAMLDPRPSGICRITFGSSPAAVDALAPTWTTDAPSAEDVSGYAVMSGQFVEVDPYRLIIFTWGWEDQFLAVPPQSTRVTVSLVGDHEGTVLRLVHERLPAESRGFHAAGWVHFLERLALAAAGRPPGTDPWQNVHG